MTDWNTRAILWLASLACVGVTIALAGIVLLAQDPKETVWLRPAVPSRAFPLSQETAKAEISEDDFQYIWKKALRGRIDDPPPVAPAVAAKPKKKAVVKPWHFDGKLLGTLVDSDRSRAWVEFKGRREMVRVGDVFEQDPKKPIVTDIQDRSVVFTANDSRHTLTLAEASLFSEVTGIKREEQGGD